MIYRELGSSGIEVSAVGLGAWAIGGWMWGGRDDQKSIAAIHAALDQGINLIDTAPAYGYGHCEEIVGRAIAGRRNQVVLATKCGLIWDREDGHLLHPRRRKRRHLAARHEENLPQPPPRLRSARNWSGASRGWAPTTSTSTKPIGKTRPRPSKTPWPRLLKLKDEGKIRAIGVSNATRG